MNKPCLLAFVDDLFFQSQIQGIAEGKKMDYYFATQGEQLSQLAKTIAPAVVVIDLSGLDSEWLFKHIGEIKNAQPRLPIIAFIAHVQETVRERAQKYGCNFVFTKSELIKELPDTVERILRGGL